MEALLAAYSTDGLNWAGAPDGVSIPTPIARSCSNHRGGDGAVAAAGPERRACAQVLAAHAHDTQKRKGELRRSSAMESL